DLWEGHKAVHGGAIPLLMVVAFVPRPEPFEFEIHQVSAWPMRDLKLDPEFDRDCEVHTREPERLRARLQDPELREAVRRWAQPRRAYGFYWATWAEHHRVRASIADAHTGKGVDSLLTAAREGAALARRLSRPE
ncbi:MAG: hypothetical protein AB1758_34905, partial [Candidatus Eremiobacterota bacterium]